MVYVTHVDAGILNGPADVHVRALVAAGMLLDRATRIGCGWSSWFVGLVFMPAKYSLQERDTPIDSQCEETEKDWVRRRPSQESHSSSLIASSLYDPRENRVLAKLVNPLQTDNDSKR
jgi:hypothetical protein